MMNVLRIGQDFDAALADCAVVYTYTLLTKTVEHVIGDGDDRGFYSLRGEFHSADLQIKLRIFLTIYYEQHRAQVPKTAKSTTPRLICSAIRL